MWSMVQLIRKLVSNYSTPDFVRLRTENLETAQRYVVDGVAIEINWVEEAIPAESTAYAEFTVPVGYKLLIDSRLLNPSVDMAFYKVFPEGVYIKGDNKTDTATTFLRQRNLRQGSPLVATIVRVNITTPPAADSHIVYEPSWGSIAAGNRHNGDIAGSSAFLILDGNQKFLLALQNASTEVAAIQLKLGCALIPEALIPPPKV